MFKEKTYQPTSGWQILPLTLGLVGGAIFLFVAAAAVVNSAELLALLLVFTGLALAVASLISVFGFQAVPPNEARVYLLFGDYKGTVSQSGFYWVNPFYSKRKISLRIRNFETGSTSSPEVRDAAGKVLQQRIRSGGRPSKVNDRDGNPIEISTIVVWRVVNTAEALFEVDDYEDFVAVQSEAALRVLASRHPYDSEDHEVSLRGNTPDISEQLRIDIQDRLEKAGVEVIEARISHLAYAAEIAAAMLQRQQAQAIVAARTKIVEGAVGMVEMALEQLASKSVVELNSERRAAMVSNLLVVLCSDRHTQPVVSTNSGAVL